jgi:hypothetical protein
MTVLIRSPHYWKPEEERNSVTFMKVRIEPYMKAINEELRTAGLVGPGRELEIHITSQAESMRTVIEWRDEG